MDICNQRAILLQKPCQKIVPALEMVEDLLFGPVDFDKESSPQLLDANSTNGTVECLASTDKVLPKSLNPFVFKPETEEKSSYVKWEYFCSRFSNKLY